MNYYSLVHRSAAKSVLGGVAAVLGGRWMRDNNNAEEVYVSRTKKRSIRDYSTDHQSYSFQKPESESWWSILSLLLSASCTPATTTRLEAQQPLAPSASRLISSKENETPIDDDESMEAAPTYDFIIVGQGTTGRSALHTLRQKLPADVTIAVVDPLRLPAAAAATTTIINDAWCAQVAHLDPDQQLVELAHIGGGNSSSTNCTTNPRTIRYRHGVLIATGCHGAPVPHYIVDETLMKKRTSDASSSEDRILELRPTLMPHNTSIDGNASQQRPVYAPEQVRDKVLQVAALSNATESSLVGNGKKRQPSPQPSPQQIAILGSGWDAIDLAVRAATAAQLQQPKWRRRKRGAAANNFSGVSLWFGTSGPASHMLPSYLSAALAKRLQQPQWGIELYNRTLVRYMTMSRSSSQSSISTIVQLYSAKSYDFLDTTMATVDLVVVAPDVTGPRGNAALGTHQAIPSHLVESRGERSWYQTWLQQSSSNADKVVVAKSANNTEQPLSLGIPCYKDDARIVVNSEYYVGYGGVYAAGSVAKFANGLTGHATVASGGPAAGQAAGHNMARQYLLQQSNSSGLGLLFGRNHDQYASNEDARRVCRADPLPIWRSDVSSYVEDGGEASSSLSDIGVEALCIGNCDAEKLSTHAVWWTNQAALRRLKRLADDEDENYDVSVRKSSTKDPIAEEERSTQRSILRGLRRRQSMLDDTTGTTTNHSKSVYGMGVVYYTDRKGRIQGIMTWGMPFTQNIDSSKRGTQPLNAQLVNRIKETIVTNGGKYYSSVETEVDHVRRNKFLEQEARQLLALAFRRGQLGQPANAPDEASWPRPLLRTTELRPPRVRVHGLLKRKQEGHGQGVLGEDLYAQHYPTTVADAPPPKPIAGVGFADASHTASSANPSAKSRAAAENLYQWSLWEQTERRWEENEELARPPKEDALWIRKGDEQKNSAFRDTIQAAYRAAISR